MGRSFHGQKEQAGRKNGCLPTISEIRPETRPPQCFARLATFSQVARDIPSHLHIFNQSSEADVGHSLNGLLKYLVHILSFPIVRSTVST